jgi:hypothetical protein
MNNSGCLKLVSSDREDVDVDENNLVSGDVSRDMVNQSNTSKTRRCPFRESKQYRSFVK